MKEVKEIDEGAGYTDYDEALSLVKDNTRPVSTELLPLASCSGYVSAGNVKAIVDSPPLDTSLKDGFTVRAQDLSGVSGEHPVTLKLVGSVFAGSRYKGSISPGETVKVCTGAPVPPGANAVVPAELCDEQNDSIGFRSGVESGQNIILAGDDVRTGDTVISQGEIITPARLTFAAISGISRLKVFSRPTAAIISIGDELARTGEQLGEGQIYASNSVHTGGWLSLLNVAYETYMVADDAELIRGVLSEAIHQTDIIITSGGVMHSERDLIVDILNDLGWEMKFRHVRMRPGKATAFGLWDGKPVFCLSGEPTSNGTGFIQFGLPGIYNMLGISGTPLITTTARLIENIKSRQISWTEFKQGKLEKENDGELSVNPVSAKSRLRAMADADCLICKPEGVKSLEKGQIVEVQLLEPGITGNVRR